MIDDKNLARDSARIPAELQQTLPRKIRFLWGGRSIYYLVGGVILSTAMTLLIIVAGSLTPKEIRDRNNLKQTGVLTYTNDVRAGGMRSATVFYTFTYKGTLYSGKAFLPREYLEKVLTYSREGEFPIVFLPRDPAINHPADWTESVPMIAYVLAIIIIIQWTILIRSALFDLRLARNGKAVFGTVTGWSYGRNGGIALKYEFRDADDLLTEGRGEYSTRQKQGSQICVLYLPEESEKSRPYPLVFFRAVE